VDTNPKIKPESEDARSQGTRERRSVSGGIGGGGSGHERQTTGRNNQRKVRISYCTHKKTRSRTLVPTWSHELRERENLERKHVNGCRAASKSTLIPRRNGKKETATKGKAPAHRKVKAERCKAVTGTFSSGKNSTVKCGPRGERAGTALLDQEERANSDVDLR